VAAAAAQEEVRKDGDVVTRRHAPLQAKQCEAGLTTDIPRGMRAMHTLRKLPQMAPKPAAARVAARRKPGELSVGSASTQPRYHSSAGTAWSGESKSRGPRAEEFSGKLRSLVRRSFPRKRMISTLLIAAAWPSCSRSKRDEVKRRIRN